MKGGGNEMQIEVMSSKLELENMMRYSTQEFLSSLT